MLTERNAPMALGRPSGQTEIAEGLRADDLPDQGHQALRILNGFDPPHSLRRQGPKLLFEKHA